MTFSATQPLTLLILPLSSKSPLILPLRSKSCWHIYLPTKLSLAVRLVHCKPPEVGAHASPDSSRFMHPSLFLFVSPVPWSIITTIQSTILLVTFKSRGQELGLDPLSEFQMLSVLTWKRSAIPPRDPNDRRDSTVIDHLDQIPWIRRRKTKKD